MAGYTFFLARSPDAPNTQMDRMSSDAFAAKDARSASESTKCGGVDAELASPAVSRCVRERDARGECARPNRAAVSERDGVASGAGRGPREKGTGQTREVENLFFSKKNTMMCRRVRARRRAPRTRARRNRASGSVARARR